MAKTDPSSLSQSRRPAGIGLWVLRQKSSRSGKTNTELTLPIFRRKLAAMQSLKDLWRGITRHPWKTASYVFTAFSVLFTIIRGVTHFLPGVKIEGKFPLTIVVIASICYGLKKVWKPSKVEIKIATTNTTIEILFGDLFRQDGIRAIAVSEFFDSKLGKPVSDKSLHGVFLTKCFGGGVESFDKQVDEQLRGVASSEVKKAEGKTKSFPIGTSVLITVNQDR